MLDVLVKRGGALVKQQHRSIAVDGARNGQSLLKNGLVDYLASDAHRVEHYATYLKALKEAQKY